MRRHTLLPALVLAAAWIGTTSCGGPPEELQETEQTGGAIALGYNFLANTQALFVERCLAAPGPAFVPVQIEVCDGNREQQGFRFQNAQIQAQNGLGGCLTARGATLKMEPCVANAPSQAWTRRAFSGARTTYEYKHGSSCLGLSAAGVPTLSACTGAKSQIWSHGYSSWLSQNLVTGEVVNPMIEEVGPAIATVAASAKTIAETKSKILRWKIHPIAYQPKDVPQTNAGVIIIAYDINDAPRAYVSAQVVRNTGPSSDFHAGWRVGVGTQFINPAELSFVGGLVKKTTGPLTESWEDGRATVTAMVRRDFLAVAQDDTLVSSTSLSKALQKTIVARAVPPLSILLLGVPGTTASAATSQVAAWTQLSAIMMPLAPRNGYVGDENAAPSLCAKSTKGISGTGVTEAACHTNLLPIPSGKMCGYQDATQVHASFINCNWVCCPIAL